MVYVNGYVIASYLIRELNMWMTTRACMVIIPELRLFIIRYICTRVNITIKFNDICSRTKHYLYSVRNSDQSFMNLIHESKLLD